MEWFSILVWCPFLYWRCYLHLTKQVFRVTPPSWFVGIDVVDVVDDVVAIHSQRILHMMFNSLHNYLSTNTHTHTPAPTHSLNPHSTTRQKLSRIPSIHLPVHPSFLPLHFFHWRLPTPSNTPTHTHSSSLELTPLSGGFISSLRLNELLRRSWWW